MSSAVNVHDIHTWLSFYSLILQDLEEITHSVNDHPVQIALLKMENEKFRCKLFALHMPSLQLQITIPYLSTKTLSERKAPTAKSKKGMNKL